MSILNRLLSGFEGLRSALRSGFVSLRSGVSGLLDRIFPRRCPVCGCVLLRNYDFICARCTLDAPLTYIWQTKQNQMEDRVRSILPGVVTASSLLYYRRSNDWKRLIYGLKYYGRQRDAERMGEWLGLILRESEHYREVDSVVGVPLHPFRRWTRGYNQADCIARGVARSMGIEQLNGVVRRIRHTTSQTKLTREQRYTNVDNIFRVTVEGEEKIRGRNLLLVDDVFTTGATITSCGEEFIRARVGCRLWIATVATALSGSDATSGR